MVVRFASTDVDPLQKRILGENKEEICSTVSMANDLLILGTGLENLDVVIFTGK